MKFIVHDGAGRIDRVIELALATSETAVRVPDGVDAASVAALSATRMVADGEVVDRPVLAGFDRLSIGADGEDAATMAGVPDSAEVLIDGVPHPVPEGGVLVLTSTMAATYRVMVRAWPYQDYAAEIVAT